MMKKWNTAVSISIETCSKLVDKNFHFRKIEGIFEEEAYCLEIWKQQTIYISSVKLLLRKKEFET